MRCKSCGHIVLFLLLGVNKDAIETRDICPMKGFTKGKLNTWLRKKKSGISSINNIFDNLKMN